MAAGRKYFRAGFAVKAIFWALVACGPEARADCTEERVAELGSIVTAMETVTDKMESHVEKAKKRELCSKIRSRALKRAAASTFD